MNRAQGKAAARTEFVLTADEVPVLSLEEMVNGQSQPSGDVIVQIGLERWRFWRDGSLKYYILYKPDANGEPNWASKFERLFDAGR